MVDLVERRFGALLRPGVERREKIEELGQVALVVANGVDTRVALVSQVVEKLIEELIQHVGSRTEPGP